jgi:hypothetical protein
MIDLVGLQAWIQVDSTVRQDNSSPSAADCGRAPEPTPTHARVPSRQLPQNLPCGALAAKLRRRHKGSMRRRTVNK